jgi:hypothetical protein
MAWVLSVWVAEHYTGLLILACRFDGVDLFEGVNLSQVTNCLNSLNKIALDKGYIK